MVRGKWIPGCQWQACDKSLDSKSSDRKIVWVRSPPPAFSLHAGLRGKIECYRDKSRIASSRTKTQRFTLYSSTNRQQRSAQYARLSLIPVDRPPASKRMALNHRNLEANRPTLPKTLRISARS